MKKLVSIVSICALMVTFGTFSIFGDINAGTKPIIAYSNFGSNVNLGNNVNVYYDVYNLLAELQTIDVDKNQESSNPKYYNNFAVSQQYTVFFKFFNYSSQPKKINPNYGYVDITVNRNIFDNNQLSNVGYHVDYVENCYCEIGSTGRVYMYPLDQSIYDGGIFLPPNSSYSMSVTFTKTYNVTIEGYADVPVLELYNQQITGVNIPSYTTSVLANSILTTNIDYNLYRIWQNTEDMESYLNSIDNTTDHIDSNVQAILNAYSNNAQNAQAVKNGTQTNEQTLSNIHQNEDTWFSQNDQALTATGVDDFTYTPQVMSGLTVISDQFNKLWLAIGDWNFIYTFSMMIGLVVLILRHNPQRKKSSAGGKSNASSS